MKPWKQLRGNLLKFKVDWADLDPASDPCTFSDLNITRQVSPPRHHKLCLKQSCFLVPWLEQFPLALKVTTKEEKEHDLADVWCWEVSSAGG